MAVFTEHDRPLSIQEVLELGRMEVESLNQATVYRNLNQMVEEEQLIRVVHPEAGALYELSGKGHHHFFHCRCCQRSFDLPGCMLKEQPHTPEGFVVEKHEIFLNGVCPSCAQ